MTQKNRTLEGKNQTLGGEGRGGQKPSKIVGHHLCTFPYLKYNEDHYPGLPRNLISTLHASEDDAIKLHGPHICSREDMNMKITKNLLIPESFGMKLDQDEKEFIGRLLSFDRSSSSHVFTIPESTIFFHKILFV